LFSLFLEHHHQNSKLSLLVPLVSGDTSNTRISTLDAKTSSTIYCYSQNTYPPAPSSNLFHSQAFQQKQLSFNHTLTISTSSYNYIITLKSNSKLPLVFTCLGRTIFPFFFSIFTHTRTFNSQRVQRVLTLHFDTLTMEPLSLFFGIMGVIWFAAVGLDSDGARYLTPILSKLLSYIVVTPKAVMMDICPFYTSLERVILRHSHSFIEDKPTSCATFLHKTADFGGYFVFLPSANDLIYGVVHQFSDAVEAFNSFAGKVIIYLDNSGIPAMKSFMDNAVHNIHHGLYVSKDLAGNVISIANVVMHMCASIVGHIAHGISVSYQAYLTNTSTCNNILAILLVLVILAAFKEKIMYVLHEVNWSALASSTYRCKDEVVRLGCAINWFALGQSVYDSCGPYIMTVLKFDLMIMSKNIMLIIYIVAWFCRLFAARYPKCLDDDFLAWMANYKDWKNVRELDERARRRMADLEEKGRKGYWASSQEMSQQLATPEQQILREEYNKTKKELATARHTIDCLREDKYELKAGKANWEQQLLFEGADIFNRYNKDNSSLISHEQSQAELLHILAVFKKRIDKHEEDQRGSDAARTVLRGKISKSEEDKNAMKIELEKEKRLKSQFKDDCEAAMLAKNKDKNKHDGIVKDLNKVIKEMKDDRKKNTPPVHSPSTISLGHSPTPISNRIETLEWKKKYDDANLKAKAMQAEFVELVAAMAHLDVVCSGKVQEAMAQIFPGFPIYQFGLKETNADTMFPEYQLIVSTFMHSRKIGGQRRRGYYNPSGSLTCMSAAPITITPIPSSYPSGYTPTPFNSWMALSNLSNDVVTPYPLVSAVEVPLAISAAPTPAAEADVPSSPPTAAWVVPSSGDSATAADTLAQDTEPIPSSNGSASAAMGHSPKPDPTSISFGGKAVTRDEPDTTPVAGKTDSTTVMLGGNVVTRDEPITPPVVDCTNSSTTTTTTPIINNAASRADRVAQAFAPINEQLQSLQATISNNNFDDKETQAAKEKDLLLTIGKHIKSCPTQDDLRGHMWRHIFEFCYLKSVPLYEIEKRFKLALAKAGKKPATSVDSSTTENGFSILGAAASKPSNILAAAAASVSSFGSSSNPLQPSLPFQASSSFNSSTAGASSSPLGSFPSTTRSLRDAPPLSDKPIVPLGNIFGAAWANAERIEHDKNTDTGVVKPMSMLGNYLTTHDTTPSPFASLQPSSVFGSGKSPTTEAPSMLSGTPSHLSATSSPFAAHAASTMSVYSRAPPSAFAARTPHSSSTFGNPVGKSS
jgi:hypothetical protein